MIRVLLVDDDERVRHGWQMGLKLEPEVVVVGAAGEIRTALRLAAETFPDIILLDSNLSNSDDLVGISRLRHSSPHSAIIIVTLYDSLASQAKALTAGASAVLTKQADFDQLLMLIHRFGTRSQL